jgi:hypothetical protein
VFRFLHMGGVVQCSVFYFWGRGSAVLRFLHVAVVFRFLRVGGVVQCSDFYSGWSRSVFRFLLLKGVMQCSDLYTWVQ